MIRGTINIEETTPWPLLPTLCMTKQIDSHLPPNFGFTLTPHATGYTYGTNGQLSFKLQIEVFSSRIIKSISLSTLTISYKYKSLILASIYFRMQ